jgi:hypothetical protein
MHWLKVAAVSQRRTDNVLVKSGSRKSKKDRQCIGLPLWYLQSFLFILIILLRISNLQYYKYVISYGSTETRNTDIRRNKPKVRSMIATIRYDRAWLMEDTHTLRRTDNALVKSGSRKSKKDRQCIG